MDAPSSSKKVIGSDQYTVDDLLELAVVPRDKRAEAREAIIGQLPWLQRFVGGLKKIPKPADFNAPLERLAKRHATASAEFKRFKDRYPLQRNAMRHIDEQEYARSFNLDEQNDALAELALRARKPRHKPKDLAKYFLAQAAYRFFCRFSTAKPSYRDIGSNKFIPFCEALYEVVTGETAPMSRHARIVIEEDRVKGKPFVTYDDDDFT